ncbi:MAG: hypothetical protein HZC02_01460 [Candidatus Levybacteria bacterium]|nr:hypothetical protein [Candidatus Levybacteria bacterium]
MKIALVFLLIIALYIEAVFTSLPIVLMALLLVTVFTKDTFVFGLSFIFGLLIDIFLVRHIGQSSLFFICSVLLVFLYERKFETKSLPFIVGASVVLSSAYFFVYPSPHPFLQIIISSIVASANFLLFSVILGQKTAKHLI